MSQPKKGEVVLVRAEWSGQMCQRFKITGRTAIAVHGIWETGPLEGKEAAISSDRFEVVERIEK